MSVISLLNQSFFNIYESIFFFYTEYKAASIDVFHFRKAKFLCARNPISKYASLEIIQFSSKMFSTTNNNNDVNQNVKIRRDTQVYK